MLEAAYETCNQKIQTLSNSLQSVNQSNTELQNKLNNMEATQKDNNQKIQTQGDTITSLARNVERNTDANQIMANSLSNIQAELQAHLSRTALTASEIKKFSYGLAVLISLSNMRGTNNWDFY